MRDFFASLGKHKIAMGALLLLGVLLIVIGGGISFHDGGSNAAQDVRGDYERSLEERLRALCLSVEGIDEAKVLVTAATVDESVSRYYASQSPQTTVRGVAVVVTRGDDPKVQRTLTELISASLGIPTNRVSVAPCK